MLNTVETLRFFFKIIIFKTTCIIKVFNCDIQVNYEVLGKQNYFHLPLPLLALTLMRLNNPRATQVLHLLCDTPYRGHLTKFLTNYPPIRLCEFHRQSRLLANFVWLNYNLNTVVWVVELTYLHIVVKCESLLGGHGKVRCTVSLSSHFK